MRAQNFQINVPVEYCCGCSACVQKCPRDALKMVRTKEGFLEPLRDENLCIGCHLCENACPEQQEKTSYAPIKCYAAKSASKDVVLNSSSGGVAYEVSRWIINQGGVVFGARFDEYWRVRHSMAETLEELNAFRGSKYVQSEIGDTFRKVKEILKLGRKVLFTGTPCQIAGLKSYLGKTSDHLYTLAIFCHGAPSPKLWKLYLQEVLESQQFDIHLADIESISFRCKEDTSGHSEQLVIYSAGNRLLLKEGPSLNDYFLAFSSHFALRESCYHCQFRLPHVSADLFVGDFWGLDQKKVNVRNENGINAVLAMTARGDELLQQLPLQKQEVELSSLMPGNFPLYFDPLKPTSRTKFLRLLGKVSIQTALQRSHLSIRMGDLWRETRLNKKLYGRCLWLKTVARHFQWLLTKEQRASLRRLLNR